MDRRGRMKRILNVKIFFTTFTIVAQSIKKSQLKTMISQYTMGFYFKFIIHTSCELKLSVLFPPYQALLQLILNIVGDLSLETLTLNSYTIAAVK